MSLQSTTHELTSQNYELASRLDELEDRSRRNNLIFYGMPDTKETWEETETKIVTELTSVLDGFSPNEIERAHRLGSFSNGKVRPIIVKFSNFKTKDKFLGLRKELKEKDLTVGEDFSPSTRLIHKKLIEFGKKQPGSPKFQLRYKKMKLNNKWYTYDLISNSIREMQAEEDASSSRQPQALT